MANKCVLFEADKARNLKFNFAALIMLEEDFGLKVADLSTGEIGFKDMRNFLYCGLKHEDETLTIEQVNDILDVVMEEKGMEYIGEKLGEALTKAFGQPKQETHPAVKKSGKR